jgi:hypothetical protein
VFFRKKKKCQSSVKVQSCQDRRLSKSKVRQTFAFQSKQASQLQTIGNNHFISQNFAQKGSSVNELVVFIK